MECRLKRAKTSLWGYALASGNGCLKKFRTWQQRLLPAIDICIPPSPRGMEMPQAAEPPAIASVLAAIDYDAEPELRQTELRGVDN